MTQAGRRDVLVVLLTAAAGAANVLSLIGLGGVPASIMTANMVLAGLSVTRRQGALGWHAGAAATYGQPRLAPLLPLALVCCVAALGLSGFGGLRGFSRGG